MPTYLTCNKPAPDGTSTEPPRTQGDKDTVGTAYSTASRIWFALSRFDFFPITPVHRAPIRFTFRWLPNEHWEGVIILCPLTPTDER